MDVTEQRNLQPNLIIFMADDLGFSDIGSYGSEIETPNIDALAESGVRLSNFYSSLTCSPSRAMLLSGADNHLIGLGNMAETIADNQIGLPGYETYLNDRVVTIAQALKTNGYHTYMAGKWHLGLEKEKGPAAKGFDRSFGLLLGGASHYDNSFGPDQHRQQALYRDDGKLIDKAPRDFFSSRYYTDRIINNIEENKNSGKPFFAFVGFTAPHWPLQFPPDYKGKYSETYKQGWQAIREARFSRLKAEGIVNDADEMAPGTADWEALSADQQNFSAKTMEIYAAMVDDMDAHVGRLIQYLRANDLYNNTAIVFLSDNGADSWGNDHGPPVVREWANTFDNRYENAGQPSSYILYGKHWANVSNTPFKDAKGNTSEGGIRVPMIVRLPDSMRGESKARINTALAGIEDIMPTFLQLAGAEPLANEKPDVNQANGNQVQMTGQSLLPLLLDSNTESQQGASSISRELWGKRGVRAGNWKLLHQPPPNGNNEWQLYNVDDDLAEQVDLSAAQPEKMKEMLALWRQYSLRNKVVLPEGGFHIREAEPIPLD